MQNENPYIATLLYGRRYSVLSPNSEEELVFKRGKGVAISAEMKRSLEINAVDQITFFKRPGEREIVMRCKFQFDPISETAAEVSSNMGAQK